MGAAESIQDLHGESDCNRGIKRTMLVEFLSKAAAFNELHDSVRNVHDRN
jgi:hypothetical protein